VPRARSNSTRCWSSAGRCSSATTPGCPASAPEIGAEDPAETPDATELFDPATTGRVIVMRDVVPIVSTVGAYVAFRLLFALAR